jgi:hypothetical protein
MLAAWPILPGSFIIEYAGIVGKPLRIETIPFSLDLHLHKNYRIKILRLPTYAVLA